MRTKPLHKQELNDRLTEQYDIIIHNDDVHTFDYVIETLVDICKHEYLQAVQCAHLIHNTGKCGVKRGTFAELKPQCEALLEKGLSAEIQ